MFGLVLADVFISTIAEEELIIREKYHRVPFSKNIDNLASENIFIDHDVCFFESTRFFFSIRFHAENDGDVSVET